MKVAKAAGGCLAAAVVLAVVGATSDGVIVGRVAMGFLGAAVLLALFIAWRERSGPW